MKREVEENPNTFAEQMGVVRRGFTLQLGDLAGASESCAGNAVVEVEHLQDGRTVITLAGIGSPMEQVSVEVGTAALGAAVLGGGAALATIKSASERFGKLRQLVRHRCPLGADLVYGLTRDPRWREDPASVIRESSELHAAVGDYLDCPGREKGAVLEGAEELAAQLHPITDQLIDMYAEDAGSTVEVTLCLAHYIEDTEANRSRMMEVVR